MQPNPKPSKLNWLEYALLAAPFLLIAVLWDKFPERIPIHWDIHRRINGWASKPFGLLLLPVTNVLLYFTLRFIQHIDPKVWRTSDENRANALEVFRIVRIATVAFLFGMFCVQAAIALGSPVSMNRFAINGCLLLFIVTGNYFTALRPNYFVGIRTPWTLESPETWRAIHRAGGRIMVYGGLLLIGVELLVREQTFAWLFITFLLGFTLWAFVYSWNYSRTHAQAR